MKISTFILSLSGLCVFYVSYADWIDELFELITEDYFGFDYEEVAPFIPSDTSGTEEFDSIVEELSNPPAKSCGSYRVVLALILLTTLAVFGRSLIKRTRVKLHKNDYIPRIAGRRKGILRRNMEDLPVQVIWKGNTLMESSVHCSLREDTSEARAHRELLRGKTRGGGDECVVHSRSPSTESTVQKLKQARRLLESEHKCTGTDDFSETQKKQENYVEESRTAGAEESTGKSEDSLIDDEMSREDSGGDPKLMNRIRLLESRLRLEELKNRNWITRMTQAESILQQLNKQVERIEQSRPVEATVMETLKITSTVTNWMPMVRPRKNYHFTLVKQYVPQFRQQPFESLSELIKREVSLPYLHLNAKRIISLPKSPLVPALPPPVLAPQTSILSKLLSK